MCNAPLRQKLFQSQASTQRGKPLILQSATSTSQITPNFHLEIVCSTIHDNISHTNFLTATMIILCINCIINSSHAVHPSNNRSFHRMAVNITRIDKMPKHVTMLIIGYICCIMLAVICVYWIDTSVNHIATITSIYSFLNGILIIICVPNAWCSSPLFCVYARPDCLGESSQSPNTTPPPPPDEDTPEQPTINADSSNDNCNGCCYITTNIIIIMIVHTIHVLKQLFKLLIDLGINYDLNIIMNYNEHNICIYCIKIIEIVFQFIFYLFCYISYSCIVVDTRMRGDSYNNVIFRLLNVSVCRNLSYGFINVAILWVVYENILTTVAQIETASTTAAVHDGEYSTCNCGFDSFFTSGVYPEGKCSYYIFDVAGIGSYQFICERSGSNRQGMMYTYNGTFDCGSDHTKSNVDFYDCT